MLPTPQCAICFADVSATRLTPCCQSGLCTICGTFDNWVKTSQTELPRCQHPDCRATIANIVGWDQVFVQTDVARLQEQIDRVNAALGGGGGGRGGGYAPPSDADRRTAAWLHGAYVHGCGSSYGISDGCDNVKCPGCGQQVNLAGDQGGTHTFYFEKFFKAIGKFGAATPATALDAIPGAHPQAWAALFMAELVNTVKAGDPNGWLNQMNRETWGPFLDFLQARVLPNTRPALDTSSLRTLYDAARSDAALTQDAHVLLELFSNRDPLSFAEQRRRMGVKGRLTDQRLQDALQANLRNDPWWQ